MVVFAADIAAISRFLVKQTFTGKRDGWTIGRIQRAWLALNSVYFLRQVVDKTVHFDTIGQSGQASYGSMNRMSDRWHTKQLSTGNLLIMASETLVVGSIVQNGGRWLVEVPFCGTNLTFDAPDYTSCLAFIEGVEQTIAVISAAVALRQKP